MKPTPYDDPLKRKRKMILTWVLLFFVIAIALIPAFFLLKAVFAVTGQPPMFWSMLITLYAAMLLGYGFFHLCGHLMRKHANWERIDHMPKVMRDMMDAMDQIAQGDFNVTVEGGEHNHYQMLTERINHMAEELRSMEHLRQDFVSNVSHEIQSPLTSISGFATLLEQEDLPPEKRRHYLGIIQAESQRLSKLSDNLLRLSMLDGDQLQLSPSAFRLDRQIEDTLVSLEPQWDKKNITLDLAIDKMEYTGDEDLLAQVWMNLAHNAVKFTPEGGTIAVTLSARDDGIVCTIRDTGIGIPEANLMHVFERFYKVDKARDRTMGGNGLGLSLVKRIIDLHGGTVGVESVEGQGTVFTIRLPLNTSTASSAEASA